MVNIFFQAQNTMYEEIMKHLSYEVQNYLIYVCNAGKLSKHSFLVRDYGFKSLRIC